MKNLEQINIHYIIKTYRVAANITEYNILLKLIKSAQLLKKKT